jgi:hypothetical protein
VEVQGRQGVFAYVNGVYDMVEYDSNDFPLYKSRHVLSAAFGKHAGASIYLFFHARNAAWALGLTPGAATVIAFSCCSCELPTDIYTPWIFEVDASIAGPAPADGCAFAAEDAGITIAVMAGELAIQYNVYPLTRLARCAVGDKSWAGADPTYAPVEYTAPEIASHGGGIRSVDPADAGGIVFNTKDNGINRSCLALPFCRFLFCFCLEVTTGIYRISHDGEYRVVGGFPLNPLGRTYVDAFVNSLVQARKPT